MPTIVMPRAERGARTPGSSRYSSMSRIDTPPAPLLATARTVSPSKVRSRPVTCHSCVCVVTCNLLHDATRDGA